jgi:hypothetical protein
MMRWMRFSQPLRNCVLPFRTRTNLVTFSYGRWKTPFDSRKTKGRAEEPGPKPAVPIPKVLKGRWITLTLAEGKSLVNVPVGVYFPIMPLVHQNVRCPACGASRKFSDIGFTPEGNFDSEKEVYEPVLRMHDFGGRGHSVWQSVRMPRFALYAIKLRLKAALGHVEAMLEAENDG